MKSAEQWSMKLYEIANRHPNTIGEVREIIRAIQADAISTRPAVGDGVTECGEEITVLREELNISGFRLDQMRVQRDNIFHALNEFYTAICSLENADKYKIDVKYFINAHKALREATQ